MTDPISLSLSLSYIVRQRKALRPKNLMTGILDEDGDAASAAVEALPQREAHCPGDRLLRRHVLDGAELLQPPDDEVVGQDSTLVLPLGDVGDQPALVERHHDIHALAVDSALQRSCEGDLQGVRRWPLELCLVYTREERWLACQLRKSTIERKRRRETLTSTIHTFCPF